MKLTLKKLKLVAAKCSQSPLLGTSHSRIPAGYHSNGHFVSAYRGNCSSSAEFSPPPQAISTKNARAAPSPPFLSLGLAADHSSPHRASPALTLAALQSKAFQKIRVRFPASLETPISAFPSPGSGIPSVPAGQVSALPVPLRPREGQRMFQSREGNAGVLCWVLSPMERKRASSRETESHGSWHSWKAQPCKDNADQTFLFG